ncbi:ribbon-helix-helix domain-containing protein [Asticcacaulis sp. ZE23SCel15]|uniref:CopG family ribbon-helix-helix protein n=1 Tax=Asticcacaulis sp. ZE23SCel15 TaxID=3059027 RepID=UPI00265DD0FE|nr:ribbon-helix-helix domain-containing protein [Asticcacaulis sp. ZE23SCel15]WKL56204.1 ribbon-helix-helix domain-containing protein [Asticcacaulis sp. ZE23SCel15]
MNTRVVTAHIPVELADQLDEISSRLDRPKGWIVKQALASWVELEARRHAMVMEALADADEGRVVGHADIKAWVNGLLE